MLKGRRKTMRLYSAKLIKYNQYGDRKYQDNCHFVFNDLLGHTIKKYFEYENTIVEQLIVKTRFTRKLIFKGNDYNKYVKAVEKYLAAKNLLGEQTNMMERLHNLERIRNERGFSREELSKLSGVNATTIQRLEKGIYNVNMVKLGTLVLLAKALHCKVVDLCDSELRRIIA